MLTARIDNFLGHFRKWIFPTNQLWKTSIPWGLVSMLKKSILERENFDSV